MEAPKLGIALGGGAARGYAHLGVMKALEDAGIVPDVVVGTSMGALTGAACLGSPSIGEAKRRLRVTLEDPLFSEIVGFDFIKGYDQASAWEAWLGRMRRGFLITQGFWRDSIIEREQYAQLLRTVLPYRDIEALPVTFGCVSADLTTGRRHLWRSGSLMHAVGASCAIPGLFPAMDVDDVLHVDGSWVEPVPVPATLEIGATFVVAIDLGDEGFGRTPESAIAVLNTANRLSRVELVRCQTALADLIVRPNLDGMHWTDFPKLEAAEAAGYQAMQARLEQLQRMWDEHVARRTPAAWLQRLRDVVVRKDVE